MDTHESLGTRISIGFAAFRHRLNRTLLTQHIVESLTCAPGKKFEEHCDTQVPALLVYCTPNPAQASRWKVRLKNAKGTNECITIGTVKDLSLAQCERLSKSA